MYLNQKKKILFNHIPKTAGTSILFQLGKNNEHWDIFMGMHVVYSQVYDKHPDIYEDLKLNWAKFTTVRNPWDHAVSYYFHIIDNSRFERERKFMPKEDYHSFERFLESHVFTQEHYTFQCRYFINDYWIQYENMKEGFDLICNKAGYPEQELPLHNKTQTSNNNYGYTYPNDYREMYTNDRMIDLVYEKSKTLVNKFGYNF